MSAALGRDDELALASLEFLGRTDDLRVRAEPEFRDAGGDVAQREPGSGADRSGSVVVAVDGRGIVQRVDIVGDWRRRIEVTALADALFEAYTTAVSAAVNAAAVSALGSVRRRERAEAPARPAPPAGEHAWRQAAWDALHEVEAELGRIRRVRREADAAGRLDRRAGPGGLFTAQLRGAVVVGISGDARLIAAADVGQLRHDATAVLRATGPGVAGHGSGAGGWRDVDGRT